MIQVPDADDVTALAAVASQAGLSLTYAGSVPNAIQQVAQAGGVSLVYSGSDRNAIETLAGLLDGGGACFVLGELSTSAQPVTVSGRTVSVDGVMMSDAESFFAGASELRAVSWPENERRRIELSQATAFDYLSMNNPESALRFARGTGTMLISGAELLEGEFGASVGIQYAGLYLGTEDENVGWRCAIIGDIDEESGEPGVAEFLDLGGEVGDVPAVSVDGLGRVWVYLNGQVVSGPWAVFGTGDEVMVALGVSLPFSSGAGAENIVTASVTASPSSVTDVQAYSDGSVGWCD